MKNETKFTDNEIQGIVDKLSVEYENCPLGISQILTMASIVGNHKFDSSNDRLLALEYSTMIECQNLNYLNCIVDKEKLGDYQNKQYLQFDNVAKRVIMTMYPERNFKLDEIDDKCIKINTDMMLKDLEVEMLERNRVERKYNALKNRKNIKKYRK